MSQVIDSIESVPQYHSNIGRKGGEVPLREADAKLVALLDLGDKQVVVLSACAPDQFQVLVAARQRAQAAGYTLLDTLPATPDVIALCGQARSQMQQVEVASLEDTDTLREFDVMLTQAVSMGASDFHLFVHRSHATVKVRINSDIHDLRVLPAERAIAMARAMYSQADAASRRRHPSFNHSEKQDASISRKLIVANKPVDLRLRWASGPAWPHGFDVSLRLLNVGVMEADRTLDSLGYRPEQSALLLDALRTPAGVIVVAGTTGSGKTTTCVTLAELWANRHGGRRLMRSIENPPEYVIANARQMPSSEEDFNDALKAAMRMDPDGLYFGEVRDAVSGRLLENGVLTGHPVLTTTHAYSVVAAIWRLQELGIPRERLTSEGFLTAIVHQYLVPILCPHCCRPYDPTQIPAATHQPLLADLGEPILAQAHIRGPGCPKCLGGISRRQVVASMLMPDAEFRRLLLAGDEVAALRRWRGGRMHRHGVAQALSAVGIARDLIAEGKLSPLDAELCLGSLAVPDPDA